MLTIPNKASFARYQQAHQHTRSTFRKQKMPTATPAGGNLTPTAITI